MVTQNARTNCGLMSRYKQLDFMDKLYPNVELNVKYPNHKWKQCNYDIKSYECDNCYLTWKNDNFIVLSRYGQIYSYDDSVISDCNSYNKFLDKIYYLVNNQTNIISKRKYRKFSVQHQLTKLCLENNWPPFWITRGEVFFRKYSIRKINGIMDLPYKMFAGHVNPYLYNVAQLDNFSLTLAKKRNDPELDKLINKWIMIDVMQ